MKCDAYPACDVCGAHHRYGVEHAEWLLWKARLAKAHETRTYYRQVPPTAETLAKISATSRGRTHSAKTKALISIKNRGRKTSVETRAKLSASTTALWRNPDWVRKARARTGHRPTSIEKRVYRWLNECGVRFHREQAIIAGVIDIFCPDLDFGIEVDGAYWHPEGNERDRHKDFERGMANIRTIRLREPEIRSGAARETLLAIIAEQRELQADLAAIRAGTWRVAA